MVKNLLAVHKTWVRSLGQKDPLKKGWLLTPVFLPGKSHRQRSLAGYGQWNCRESDTTEQLTLSWVSLVTQMVKNLLANIEDIRDAGSVSGLGRSPEGRHGNPLQYSCLESPMDRGAWLSTVHRVTKSQT